MRFWPAVLLSLAILGIGFLVADCCGGSATEQTIAKITSKRYIPPQTTTTVTTDGNGTITVNTSTSPEEFWFDVWEPHSFAVSKTEYQTYSVGDRIYITHHLGRWTGMDYKTSIVGPAMP